MSGSRDHYCIHCNLRVAPSDPSRVQRGKKVAHKECVIRRSGEEIRRMAARFLARHTDEVTARAFTGKLERTVSYNDLFFHVQWALQRLYRSGTNGSADRQTAIGRFAVRVGRLLLAEIDYSVPRGVHTGRDSTVTT